MLMNVLLYCLFCRYMSWALMGIQRQLDTDRYLGLPILFGRSKRLVFRALKDRI